MRVGATWKGRASHLQKTARQSNLATISALFSFSEEAIEIKQIDNDANCKVSLEDCAVSMARHRVNANGCGQNLCEVDQRR